MSGLLSVRKSIQRWISRRNYSISIFFSGFLLTAFISFAIYDFLQTAKAKDEQIQTVGLNNELAQFILGLREDDGYPLLDNPEQLSKVERPLSVIFLRKPFFTYFLNSGNLKTFSTKEIHWEMPRSCTVEFTSKVADKSGKEYFSNRLKACFAAIPGDLNGKYIYFALKYPTREVNRHTPGTLLSNADFIAMSLKGERELKLNLVFHASDRASSRYPSKMARFSGFHEVTAYSANDMRLPLMSINAQAFEQIFEDENNAPQNYVTVLGRINANLLYPSLEINSAWPSSIIRNLNVSISTNHYNTETTVNAKSFEIPYGTYGSSLISLEQLYVSLISSKADLEIFKENNQQVVWRSNSLDKTVNTTTGLIQKFSDWWAKQILKIAGYKSDDVIIHKQIYGSEGIEISLKGKNTSVPDIAARSFLWLWLALVLTASFGLLCYRAISQLKKITKTAYAMTASPTAGNGLEKYKDRTDEIGTLGKTFNLLFKRARARNNKLIMRIKREEHEHNEAVRAAQEQIKSRHAVLEAIGHEIKSPLQSLLVQMPPNSQYRDNIERMKRAVDALYEATSVEAGLQSGTTIIKEINIAEYLKILTLNLTSQHKEVIYESSDEPVRALGDPILLNTVLDNILDNAFRHKTFGTYVKISLKSTDSGVHIEIFNIGENIPSEQIESIFNYGVSTRGKLDNKGIGLFSARSYMVSMRGTIYAENKTDGVAFIITLPTVLERNI